MKLKVSDLILTEAEVELILEMRAEEAATKRQNLLTLHLLQAAAEFEAWRQWNGVGTSFSTFCDDFDYPGPGDEFLGVDTPISRFAVYKGVMELISSARKISLTN